MDVTILKEVRDTQPLIHNITNSVVMNFTANGLLAFGGSPIMANAEEEAAEVAQMSQGVLINIGTLTEAQVESMILAGKAANDSGIPVVLDPVGIAATDFRSRSVHRILEEVRPTLIKGNAGELAHLVGIEVETKGVDSSRTYHGEEIVRKVAGEYKTTVVLTGEQDIVCDGHQMYFNTTGHPLLSKITGAGCLLGSIIAASLTTTGTVPEQAHTALEFYGLAAEQAVEHEEVDGPGSFVPRFLDALAMEPEEWRGVAK